MDKLSIRDLPLEGKRVLMRVDFNTPMHKDGTIADDARIRAAIPSIQHVISHGGKLILMSHLGRPKGDSDRAKLTLAPIRTRLEELLQSPLLFSPEAVGSAALKRSTDLKKGEILLLENLRFYPG